MDEKITHENIGRSHHLGNRKPVDCLICTRNAMPIALLLQMTGGWVGGGVVELY